MSERGYIAISRGFFDHEIFKREPFTEREAFQWLIMEASWEDRRVKRNNIMVDVPRGQLAHSFRFMAKAWQWNEPKVRRFLARLEREEMLTLRSTQAVTHITICNYDKYQSQRRTDDAEDDAQTTQPRRKLEPLNHSNHSEGYTSDDFDTALGCYNASAARVGWPIAQHLSAGRKKKLAARMDEVCGVEGWAVSLARAEESDFLAGRSSRGVAHAGWTPNLDFFLQAKSFTKLIEGSYDNRESKSPAGPGGFAAALQRLGTVSDDGRSDSGGNTVPEVIPRLRVVAGTDAAGVLPERETG